MFETRNKIIQSDILVFVEAQAKNYRNTLNLTVSVTYCCMKFSFVLLKSDPLPSNLPRYGPVRLFKSDCTPILLT